MRIKRPALQCATVGIMAAALECVKLALSFIPNVEAVTLFSAVFGYCFGTLGVLASLIFVLIEPLVWGFGPWVVSYIIYWPSLTAIFAIIGARVRKKGSCEMKSVPLSNGGTYESTADVSIETKEDTNTACARPLLGEGSAPEGKGEKEKGAYTYPTHLVILVTSVAVGMTFLFGVLSSLVEVGLFSGAFDNFLFRFAIYYARGVWFYVAQIITNLVAFPLLFVPLTRTVFKIKPRV